MRANETAATESHVKLKAIHYEEYPRPAPLPRWVPAEEAYEAGQIELTESRQLTDQYTEDDFPSIAVEADGDVWVVWAAYNGEHDELRVSHGTKNVSETALIVPGTSGDIWMPLVAVTGNDTAWLIWSQQVEHNWDLYAREVSGAQWGPLQRLTSHSGSDINPALASDGQGRIDLVWQSFRDGNSDIYLSRLRSGAWESEIRITEDASNDWFPAVALTPDGSACVAWDSYRNGNYDIFMTRVSDSGEKGNVVSVSVTPYHEVFATIAVDAEERTWVAWEKGDINWGKDQGAEFKEGYKYGTPLLHTRSIGLVCFDKAGKAAAFEPVIASLPPTRQSFCHTPRLVVDNHGRLWCHFRHLYGDTLFTEFVTYAQSKSWAPARALPNSAGRVSMFVGAAPASEGGLWLAWPTDSRVDTAATTPASQEVFVARATANEPVAGLVLNAYQEPEIPVASVYQPHETEDIAAIRGYEAEVYGETLKIFRADLHRHTEFSMDSGGKHDGSVLDFYRYMIDVADMDFGSLSDHLPELQFYRYWWWLSQKTSDMYLDAGHFTTLFAYERGAPFPHGHRIVYNAQRGHGVIPYFRGTSGALSDVDTKLLYEQLHREQSISIPHTTGTTMGTNWRDHDPEVEPVVEIYQGKRQSYEYPGAPRAADPTNSPVAQDGGFKPEGYVHEAWAKGYRLGVIASSDHISTHMSYAMVYAPENSRETLIDAIRKRHTYAATDNIILDFRINGQLMGDEISASGPPELRINANGTGDIAAIVVFRNNEVLQTLKPEGRVAEYNIKDAEAGTAGLYWYYVRVEQVDGQLAWSSPIWVNVK